MIGTQTSTNQKLELKTSSTPRTHTLTGPELQSRLRTKRSESYVKAMTALDVGGHVFNQAAVHELIATIQAELPEVEFPQLPLGIVAKCYLGAPYEVHTLDRDLSIVRHFTYSESLPGLLERARGLALHPAYAFIEVYTNQLVAVRQSGDVTVTTIQE